MNVPLFVSVFGIQSVNVSTINWIWVFTFLFPGLVIIRKLEGLLEFSVFWNNNGKRYRKTLSLERAYLESYESTRTNWSIWKDLLYHDLKLVKKSTFCNSLSPLLYLGSTVYLPYKLLSSSLYTSDLISFVKL